MRPVKDLSRFMPSVFWRRIRDSCYTHVRKLICNKVMQVVVQPEANCLLKEWRSGIWQSIRVVVDSNWLEDEKRWDFGLE